MNPEEQSYFRFALAIAIILVTVVSFATIIRDIPESPKPVEKPSFEKVAEYENCDIIRWTDPSNRFQYFMKCSQ